MTQAAPSQWPYGVVGDASTTTYIRAKTDDTNIAKNHPPTKK